MGTNNAAWVGRQERSSDTISELLVNRIAAIFDSACPGAGEQLPPLWHWAFFQEPVAERKLGPDGHLARGAFLPPIEGRIRMWAGGNVEFVRPLTVGDTAERHSAVTAVTEKTGRTGNLVFVAVEHTYLQNDEVCIREQQDIVYRVPAPPKLESSAPMPAMDWLDSVYPSSVMLFRYSAVTFNGHRIHYDHPYARQQEGYPGLVVQAPLIATLLLSSFTQRFPSLIPRHFAYRGLRPLIADSEFQIGGAKQRGQRCALWAFSADGPAHRAEIQYEEAP